jgi:predicted MFS family arabinose efflux permease
LVGAVSIFPLQWIAEATGWRWFVWAFGAVALAAFYRSIMWARQLDEIESNLRAARERSKTAS